MTSAQREALARAIAAGDALAIQVIVTMLEAQGLSESEIITEYQEQEHGRK